MPPAIGSRLVSAPQSRPRKASTVISEPPIRTAPVYLARLARSTEWVAFDELGPPNGWASTIQPNGSPAISQQTKIQSTTIAAVGASSVISSPSLSSSSALRTASTTATTIARRIAQRMKPKRPIESSARQSPTPATNRGWSSITQVKTK